MELTTFLATSYTPYHTVQNAAAMLAEAGFTLLDEREEFPLAPEGKYYLVRGGSLIAFRCGKERGLRVAATHTDSPCFKLKERPLSENGYTRLNIEPYGGGIWYTFFDRPLRIAGRIVRETARGLEVGLYTSPFTVVLPSLAIHQNRTVNEHFAPDLQKELPLLALGDKDFSALHGAVSFDLFAVPAEEPVFCGADGEFLCSPRIDDLTGVYASIRALIETEPAATAVAAALCGEEIGSRVDDGAGGDFLKTVLERICRARGERTETVFPDSLLLSSDNAHALHPNHPETSDPADHPVLGGGIAIKTHADGAYTTNAVTSALTKTIFSRAGVKWQLFYNRTGMKSGATLGAISLAQACIPSADIGIAQLAMHSASETVAAKDCLELQKGLAALYESSFRRDGSEILF